jgi:hypothetical protein
LKTTAKRGFVLLFYGGTEGWWEGLHGWEGDFREIEHWENEHRISNTEHRILKCGVALRISWYRPAQRLTLVFGVQFFH